MTARTPELSVVICTHDRYAALHDSVERLVASSGFADPRCELLVVDNTPKAKRRPVALPSRDDVRLTCCDVQGLSHARNHGIGAARGGVIAFIDDDALVSDRWCTAVLDRMLDDRELLVMGGRVDPLYSGDELPEWYDDRLASYLSCIDWSVTPRFLREGEWVVGANIVFRRSVFDTYGVFDVNLGRRGAASLLSNEETALLTRLGIHRVFYDPAARVDHVIPVERLTRRWFRRRVYWQAISDLVAGHARDDDPSLRREYGEVISQLEPAFRNLNALTFDPDDRETFQLQLRAIYLAAIVLGYGGVAG